MVPGLNVTKLAVYGFVAIFCAIGAGIIYGAIGTLQNGETTDAVLMFIAALVFGGFGVGVFALTSVGFRSQAREASLRADHPDEPWRWRDDWAIGRIRSTGRSSAWFFWGFALLWNLISTPMLMFLPTEIIDNDNYPALLGLLFPLVGIGLIVVAVRKTIQRRKYGDCVFLMTRIPGILGGEVTGTILIPRGMQAARNLNVRLSCVRMERRGSGKQASTYENVLWQTDQSVVPLSPMVDGSVQGATVRFSVPYDASPSGEIDDNNSVLWKLEANATVQGVDFATIFEIPVFKTQASSPQITEERIRSEDVATDTQAFTPDVHSGVTIVTSEKGGKEFIIKQQRGMQSAAAGMVIVPVLGGIAAAIAYAGAPLIFPLVFGAFAVLVTLLLFFGAFGESRIIVEDRHVRVRNSLFGIMTGIRMPCSSITKIGVKGESQSGKNGHYSITFTQENGKSTSPLQSLSERREADWLADEIRKAMEPWRGK